MSSILLSVALTVVAAVVVVLVVIRLRRAAGRAPWPQPLATTQVHVYRTGQQGRFVGIVTGDLRRARCAEVWVNSENTAMQMARFDEFSVSSIIRYEGARRNSTGRVVDDRIADELARRVGRRPNVPAGSAIVTESGELRNIGVRYIVHVAAVHGEPGAGFRQVREVGRCVSNVLHAVDEIDATPPARTVLFPLLGVGQGGGAPRQTADELLGATIDYFSTRPASHVTAVFFLAYTDIELLACEQACAALGLSLTTDPKTIAEVTKPAIEPSRANREPAEQHQLTKRLQMGFVIDVVGFGQRDALSRDAIQQRLSAIADRILAEVDIDLDGVDHQWSGDGLAAALPTDIDPPRVLSGLLGARRQLAEDNRRHADRIRLRMAVGVGLVGAAATGFAGAMIVDVNRLVESPALRTAVRDHPESDLAVLISNHLYDYVIGPGYLDQSAAEFRRVDIAVKEFREPAWLWVAPPAGK